MNQASHITHDFAGVCHADELMHLFNVPIPIVLCDLTDFVGA
jgi:hypothetical protein